MCRFKKINNDILNGRRFCYDFSTTKSNGRE